MSCAAAGDCAAAAQAATADCGAGAGNGVDATAGAMGAVMAGARRVALDPARLPAVGQRVVLHLEGHSIAFFGTADGWRAIADSCPHQGASLAGGKVEGGAVQCPAHGLRFDLATGCLRNAPALKVAVYPIETGPDGHCIVLPAKESI